MNIYRKEHRMQFSSIDLFMCGILAQLFIFPWGILRDGHTFFHRHNVEGEMFYSHLCNFAIHCMNAEESNQMV